MSEERTANAITRIEAALKRIEAASSAPAGNGAAAEFSHLATRHDRLRDEVRGALEAIDALSARVDG